ncbi:MAG: glycosyltransferase family 2 protein [Nitrospiraceae bacterium]|nr:glycosyltransferase family 2 protein [Nitrospiraceae bacterium]
MLLSVVFSFRNEEQGLDELIKRVKAAIEPAGMDFEMIFVNDDSTDRSLEILEKNRESDKRIKIITMSRRFGIHPCVIAGLRHAQGDAIVYMDADLQDPPEVIPQLIEKWTAGADVVNTVRTERLGENAFKMWLTRRAYQIINRISDISLPQNMGDFKLLSRRVVEELLLLQENDPFMRGLVRWVGFRQESVYYVRDARFAGKTHFSLFGSGPAKEFIRGVTSFSAVPLYFTLIMGIFVSLMSFLMIAYVLTVWSLGLAVPGWAGVMCTVLFLSGMLLLSNGFSGIYIGRIYEQVKNRPLYIIKNKRGFDEN